MTERVATGLEGLGVLLVAFGGYQLAHWLGYMLLGLGLILFGIALTR